MQGVTNLFQDGGSQAVRLPHKFRFSGSEVRVTRILREFQQIPHLRVECWHY